MTMGLLKPTTKKRNNWGPHIVETQDTLDWLANWSIDEVDVMWMDAWENHRVHSTPNNKKQRCHSRALFLMKTEKLSITFEGVTIAETGISM